MHAVEFEANIVDGAIEVPIEYRNQVAGRVRVIILSPEREHRVNIIDKLLAESLEVEHFQPLTRDEIYRD